MKGTKARRSVGMIGNSLDHVSGSWERNESAQNKGDDNHGKKKRRNKWNSWIGVKGSFRGIITSNHTGF